MRMLAVILILACAGCDNSQASVNRAQLPKTIPGSGIVRGVVRFAGTAPVMKPITVNEACCKTDPPQYEQTVVVNPNGTLRNVFIYLEGAPATDGSGASPALLDQVHCRYEPHVFSIQAGQSLRVRSSDPTMHNVHYIPQMNPARNLSMTAAGQETTVRFDYAEFIRVKCDVHPWMTAWVGVFENPFFATTGDDGSFEIENLPAGTFKLVAWHELYGKQEKTISVVNDQPIEMNFEFGPRV